MTTTITDHSADIDLNMYEVGRQPAPSPVEMDLALDQVRAELARVDNKAIGMFALDLGLLTIAAAGLTRPGLAATAVVTGAVLTVGPLVGSMLALLAALMPRLGGGHGIVAYANTSGAADVEQAVVVDNARRAMRLRWQSRSTVRKYQRIRTAVLLAGAAIVTGTTLAAAVSGMSLINQ